ncbi:MAG: ATP12 family chaperone protein [Janthinobacterium lividum]
MKRFYEVASAVPVEDGWALTLDGREVKTPAHARLRLPNAALANAAAAEWSRQGKVLKPLTMPLTGFAYAAVDRIAPDPQGFAATLSRFVESELLCYRADGPVPLVRRQSEEWDPLLGWAAARYDISFIVTSGVIHKPQAVATLARVGAAYAAFNSFQLAALHPVVTICGSAIIGLAVAENHLDADQAFAAGQLDELWQAEQWGTDPLALASLAERRAALDNAIDLLRLLA